MKRCRSAQRKDSLLGLQTQEQLLREKKPKVWCYDDNNKLLPMARKKKREEEEEEEKKEGQYMYIV